MLQSESPENSVRLANSPNDHLESSKSLESDEYKQSQQDTRPDAVGHESISEQVNHIINSN